jgi:hypothetical protein
MTPCVMVDSGRDSNELDAAAMKRVTCATQHSMAQCRMHTIQHIMSPIA